MIISDLLKNPKKHIPHGIYCYDDHGICPFWENRPNEFPHHETGFCYFLNKSDWDINDELNASLKIVYDKENSLTDTTIDNLDDEDNIDTITGKKIHRVTSLMWNKVKSCDTNDKYN